MKHFLFCLLAIPASAETLHYTINWPSGLSLGEATLQSDRVRDSAAAKGVEHWHFTMDIDASVPGFTVRDKYESNASAELCSTWLDKSYTHGKHKSDEHITFDSQKNTATRETKNGGGKSELSVSPCARDPLTFIQFARRELALGRLAPQQQVVFGAVYQVRIEYTGGQTIRLADQKIEADRIVATIKGPSTDVTVEMFFSRDAARVPLMAKVPLALGTFSVELQKD
jgi:hypothetical protein